MRLCEASKRGGGKVWIRGFLYGKHLHWRQRYCTFTVVLLRYLQNYTASAAPIAHPACPGTLLWVTQGCKSMFRNTSPSPKAVTLFSGGYSKQTFETTVFCDQFECQLPPKIKYCKLFTLFFSQSGWMPELRRSVFSQNVIMQLKRLLWFLLHILPCQF